MAAIGAAVETAAMRDLLRLGLPPAPAATKLAGYPLQKAIAMRRLLTLFSHDQERYSVPMSQTSPLLIFSRPCYKWNEVKGPVPPRQQKAKYTETFPRGYAQTTFRNSLITKALELSAEAAKADGASAAAADLEFVKRAIRGPVSIVYNPFEYASPDQLAVSVTDDDIASAAPLEYTMAKMPKILKPFKDNLLLARVCNEWMVGSDYVANAAMYAPAIPPPPLPPLDAAAAEEDAKDQDEGADDVYASRAHAEILGIVQSPPQRIRFMLKAHTDKDKAGEEDGDEAKN